MGILSTLRKILPGTAAPADPATQRKGWLFYSGYDATKPKNKRQSPTGLMRDEDRELPDPSRRVLISGTRDINRNFSLVGWAIRKHLDYVSTFRFRAKTSNPTLDKDLNAFIRKASTAENFDAAGRHPLRRAMRMSEARKIIDGDIVFLKLNNGKISIVEGDRIRTPYAGLPPNIDARNVRHGVIVDDAGKALGYVLCKRAKTSDVGYTGQDMVFERVLKSQWVYLHACWDSWRFDQVRGISPLASACNQYRDVYEGLDYALIKAKIAQLFALAVMRDASPDEGAMGEVSTLDANATDGATSGDGVTASDPPGTVVGAKPRYEVDFGKGPVMLDLDPGDKAEILESATPSTEFQQFIPLVLQIALKSLDIPYSFFDEAHTNYSGQKQAWILYEKSAEAKRADNIDFLNDWTRWRLGIAVDDGELILPAGMTVADLQWEWRHAGTPWLDQVKEAVGRIAAIEGSLQSPIEAIEETTDRSWEEILEDKAAFLAKHDELGIPRPAWAVDAKAALTDDAPADGQQSANGGNPKGKPAKGKTAQGQGKTRKSAYDVALAMAMTATEESHA